MVPLTAVVILEMAVEPKETTVWATICSPPVTTEESVLLTDCRLKHEGAYF